MIVLEDHGTDTDYIAEWQCELPDHSGEIVITRDEWKRPYGNRPRKRIIKKWKWA